MSDALRHEAPPADANSLSEPDTQLCACCNTVRLCRLFMLQNCTAAWVCAQCRKGT